MKRYSLRLSRDVPNAGGYRNMLRIGLPEQNDMINDICICSNGSYEFVALNSNVLRQALLNDKEFTKQVLKIEVKDITIDVEKKQTKKQVVKEEVKE